jgi:hypothetical protein
MNEAVPDARASGYTHRIKGIVFPDPDDRHVIAVALECGAELIVSADRKHFNERSLSPYGLRRISPDDLLCDRLDKEPELVVEVTDRARLALTRTRPDRETYLDILEKTGLPRFSASLRHLVLDRPGPEETDQDPPPPGSTGCKP